MTKIAQVGCGYWGKNLAKNFGNLGYLGAIVDDSPIHADSLAQEFSVRRMTLEDVLSDPSINAISCATPAETHASVVARALEAGKHVFVEKPLALTLLDARSLVDLASRHNRTLMVGHLLQYHPVFAKLRQLVKDDEIGTLRYIYSNRLSLGKFRIEEDVLWSFAPHDVSMILALTGEVPEKVEAFGQACLTDGISDWTLTQLTFPSGVKGHIQAAWLHPFKEHRLVVVGEKGTLVFEDSKPLWGEKLAFYEPGIVMDGPVPIAEKSSPKFIAVPQDEPLKLECQHFVECISTGQTPLTDGVEGVAVLDVLTRATRSLEQ